MIKWNATSIFFCNYQFSCTINTSSWTNIYINKFEPFSALGDKGYYDKDGYFYIVDRMKELIMYKGFQVMFTYSCTWQLNWWRTKKLLDILAQNNTTKSGLCFISE